MTATPDISLATHIADNVSGATLNTNVFHSPVVPPDDYTPAKAVFCLETGGSVASPDCGTAKRTVYPHIQVRVRGEEGDYRGGKEFADLVFRATEHASVAGYINVRNLSAMPNYIGTDNNRRHEWSWYAEMIFEE